ncbi:nuclear transport factor 2 family protein [Actinomadura darangshiensis]|uniref:Nuclear transport factor 2 family protein n=1 Tax=Actinomadura darangshiensis TaxID=705336 RepID=A0A4R5BVD3_9ACTN|nr:nuclear transport factor 2 family protein [Actinomadura darangshiensis]TDD91098.1 nuclear transport factor 2 family protein [Actinomadura darangshiensis]
MTPDEFPAVFAEGWALPKPDAFLDRFLPLIHGEAVFSQPMFPDAHGIAEIEEMFRRLFTLFPDMALAVRHSAVQGNIVFIESDCTAVLGRKPVRFRVCDRFVLASGTIRARRSFSDPLPVLLAGLRRPSSWPRLVRSRVG